MSSLEEKRKKEKTITLKLTIRGQGKIIALEVWGERSNQAVTVLPWSVRLQDLWQL